MVRAEYSPPAERTTPDGDLSWTVALGRHATWELALDVTWSTTRCRAVVLAVRDDRAFSIPTVHAGDHRLTELLTQSVERPERVARRRRRGDARPDAGRRRALVPHLVRPGFALGRPDGRCRSGPDSPAAPCAHWPADRGSVPTPRLRRSRARSSMSCGGRLSTSRPSGHSRRAVVLPPAYYGSVDATSLWITLLHDAWRWGLPTDEVEALLPTLLAAARLAARRRSRVRRLHPVRRYHRPWAGEPGLEGLRRRRPVRRRPAGRAADRPLRGAGLRARRGLHAAAPARRVRSTRRRVLAWLGRAAPRPASGTASGWRTSAVDYPAIALDRHGAPVDTVTSNLGHLLGTGLLDEDETAAVVRRLAAADLDSGFGLRTMSARAAGYNPLSYHCGSVWPHDTAIAIAGLAASPGPEAASAAPKPDRRPARRRARIRRTAAGALRRPARHTRPAGAIPVGVPAAGLVGRGQPGHRGGHPRTGG